MSLSRVAAVAGASAILVTGVSAYASANAGDAGASASGSGQITGAQIKNNSVDYRDVHNIGWNDFNSALKGRLLFRGYADRTYAKKAELADKADKGDSYTKKESDERYAQKSDIPAPGEPGTKVTATSKQSQPTPITAIGGKFSERNTVVDTIPVEAGTYQITGDGFFYSTDTTSGQTRLQLALRTYDDAGKSTDVGTCFTGAASVLKDREATCSTTRVITFDAPTNISVRAFGYADDQGSADSGKFNVVSTVNLLKVG